MTPRATTRFLTSVVIGIVTAAICAPALAQCLLQELTLPDPEPRNIFGRSVAIDGDVAVVGAVREPEQSADPGVAAVFRRVDGVWRREAELQPSGDDSGELFAQAVDVSGDRIVVASSRYWWEAGPVYVFRYDGTSWIEETKLTSDQPDDDDRFGGSVAIDNDTIAIGAEVDNTTCANPPLLYCGAVHVFRYDGTQWTREAKLGASDAAGFHLFGRSVSISGNSIAAGSPKGGVYVFDRDESGWSQTAVLLPERAGSGDGFGSRVAIDGNTIAAGAFRDDDRGDGAGAAYVFRRSNGVWEQEAKLTGADTKRDDGFGTSLVIHADTLIVGNGPSDDLSPGGAIYVFRRGNAGWVQRAQIRPSDSAFGDGFGSKLGISDGALIVGASGRDDLCPDDPQCNSGAVFIYDILGGEDCDSDAINDACQLDCNANGIADPCDIATETSLDCQPDGIPDECQTDCQGNGTPDDCDIRDAVSSDCQPNGIPDECDIGFGHFADDDADGVVDACERRCLTTVIAQNEVEPPYSLWDYVAIDGEYAAVANRGPVFPDGPGSAYIYRRVGTEWTEDARIYPADGAYLDAFGTAVAIGGNHVLVGSRSKGVGGTVYVYHNDGSGWLEQDRLTTDVAESFFGESLAMDGDVVVIGAGREDEWAGAAYVYIRAGTQWVRQAKLVARDAERQDYFGAAVAIDGDWIVVGSRNDDDACPEDDRCQSGSAYVFRRSGSAWIQEAKLTASDSRAGDEAKFGFAVAISGDYILIGARATDGESEILRDAGAAYVFHYEDGQWIETAKLVPSDTATDDLFGQYLALEDDVAVISALLDADPLGRLGSHYVFRRIGDEWIEDIKLYAAAGEPYLRSGGHVAISGGHVVAGAVRRIPHGPSSSFAYFHAVGPDCDGDGSADFCQALEGTLQDCTGNAVPDSCEPDCNENGIADSCDTLSGFSADCTGNEIPDECEPDCNQNGVADTCDIAEGVSTDHDQNGLPDDCEIYGDTNDDGKTDILDILCVLDGFRDVYNRCTFEQINIAPCEPDGRIDIFDIFAVIDAFAGSNPCDGG